MLRGILVLFSFLFTINSIASSQDDREALIRYWADTGLTIDFVYDQFKATCYKDAKGFLACLQGVNVLASGLKGGATLATTSEASQNPEVFGAIIKSYGPYNLYKIKGLDSKLTDVERWEKSKAIRTAEMNAATAVFNNLASQPFDFSVILNELKPQVIQGRLANAESAVAADIYNTIIESAVDPHTHIDPVVKVKKETKSTDNNFVGIGVNIRAIDGKIVVINPILDGPSIKAGVRAGDIIASIDGVSVKDFDLDSIPDRLRGADGSSVKVGFIRKGNPIEITIVRANVNVKNVDIRVLRDNNNDPLGYIKITNFVEAKACAEVAYGIQYLQSEKVKGLILDLRGDPGGLVDGAVCIGAIFLGNKPIVKIKDLENGTTMLRGWNPNSVALTDLPMVTLIDAGSASASEILAGALQDYQRSWIAGDRSFGKATAQDRKFLTDENGKVLNNKIFLYHTTERFYQPKSGRTNQIVGILPDFPVDPKPNATADEKFERREGDLYTNALPAESDPWVEPRPQEVAKIQDCVKTKDIDKVYASHADDAYPADYQLLTAQAILGCQL